MDVASHLPLTFPCLRALLPGMRLSTRTCMHPNSVTRYDFNKPDDIPKELHHVFDCVVIDPPFITREVWEKYAAAAKLLLSDSGKVIGTTVAENGAMLAEIIPGMAVTKFKPSIPNLIYQYNLFTTFPPKVLCEVNPEIPDDD
eukprot:100385-Chlamydomonas_euryale.AAC.18